MPILDSGLTFSQSGNTLSLGTTTLTSANAGVYNFNIFAKDSEAVTSQVLQFTLNVVDTSTLNLVPTSSSPSSHFYGDVSVGVVNAPYSPTTFTAFSPLTVTKLHVVACSSRYDRITTKYH